MSIGHDIIDEIGKQGMFAVAHPDPDASHVFVWSSGAGEQLHALVMDSQEVRDLQRLIAQLEKVLLERNQALKEIKRLANAVDETTEGRFNKIYKLAS